MLRVRTQNSVYEIDEENKKWARLETNGVQGDNPLRTLSGTYINFQLDNTLRLFCEPIDPTKDVRVIQTSRVVSTEREN